MNNYISDKCYSNYIREQQKVYNIALEYPFAIRRHIRRGEEDSSICLIEYLRGN